MVGNPEDTDGAVRNQFASDANVTIAVLLKNNGSVTSNATVTAVVQNPNGNATNVTLYFNNETNEFQGNYSPSAGQGTYTAKIVGVLNSTNETTQSYMSFGVSSYRVGLVVDEDVFSSFGNDKAITPSSQVVYVLTVFNNS